MWEKIQKYENTNITKSCEEANQQAITPALKPESHATIAAITVGRKREAFFNVRLYQSISIVNAAVYGFYKMAKRSGRKKSFQDADCSNWYYYYINNGSGAVCERERHHEKSYNCKCNLWTQVSIYFVVNCDQVNQYKS